MAENKLDQEQVRVNFRFPVRMPSLYAHHMLVQEAEHEVVLSFFETVPPIFLAEPTEAREARVKMIKEEGINADCIARISIAKARYPSFAEAIQETLNRIQQAKSAPEPNADTTNNDK